MNECYFCQQASSWRHQQLEGDRKRGDDQHGPDQADPVAKHQMGAQPAAGKLPTGHDQRQRPDHVPAQQKEQQAARLLVKLRSLA